MPILLSPSLAAPVTAPPASTRSAGVWLRGAKRFRKPVSRLVVASLVAVLAVSASAWPGDGLARPAMAVAGSILLVLCAFGRLWASLFIAGYKNDRLVTEGPYSLVRNPLYLFSLLGVVGIGLACGSLLVCALLLLPFLAWYPVLVAEEEAVLAERFGEAWRTYAATTPRFLPALRRPTAPERYTVDLRSMQRALADAVWFPLAAIAIRLVAELHGRGFLPTHLLLP